MTPGDLVVFTCDARTRPLSGKRPVRQQPLVPAGTPALVLSVRVRPQDLRKTTSRLVCIAVGRQVRLTYDNTVRKIEKSRPNVNKGGADG